MSQMTAKEAMENYRSYVQAHRKKTAKNTTGTNKTVKKKRKLKKKHVHEDASEDSERGPVTIDLTDE